MGAARAPVAIIMGSRSDWPTMKAAAEMLELWASATRPRWSRPTARPSGMYAFAKGAKAAGFKVIIAGAGGAAHLPGMTASHDRLPVLGVPIESKALKGMDSLLSIAQMPGGIPVGTLAIGEAGARNAGLLAAAILALSDAALAERLAAFRAARPTAVAETSRGLSRRARLPAGARASTIGVLGGGQLGRMLAMAAARLGFDVVILTPEADACAARVAGAHHRRPPTTTPTAWTPWPSSPTWSPSSSRTCRPPRSRAWPPGRRGRAGRRSPWPSPRTGVDEKTFLNACGAPTVRLRGHRQRRGHRAPRSTGSARRPC